jgi:hypothetical protein
MPRERTRGVAAAQLLVFFLVYSALAIAVTYPLAARLGDGVPHDRIDPLLNTWLLWWNARSVPFTAGWWNGPFFHPIHGVLSFSENLVGLSPLTTPLQWLGASPLAACNLACILSFALSALAMHLLCRSLRMRTGLCLVAGLAYGFAPYRAGHVAHLQILSAYFIPLVFLGLHRFLETGRRRWLGLFAVAWILQGLTNGYYLVFVSVLVGAWLAWFVPPRRDWGRAGGVLLAWTLAGLALVPVLRQYSLWHTRYGFARSIQEIESLSADVLSLVSPADALAHWPARVLKSPEMWLFPGLTLPLIVATFLVAWRWRRRLEEGPVATAFVALATVAAATAAVTAVTGPWLIKVGGVSISIRDLSKPLALAFYGLLLGLLSSRSLRAAWRRGSVLAFYLIASGCMIVLALGPGPRAAGIPIWAKAPYWYLLQLPGVDALRSPARFAMLAVFCLALAGALALGRLVEGSGRRGRMLVVLAAAGILWDGWIALPILEVPASLRLAPPERAGAVLELPLGDERDASAMYRSMVHGLPVLNGYSGYVPPHYHALRLGIERREPGVLGVLREEGPLFVLLDLTTHRSAALDRLILAEPGVHLLGEERGRRAYLLPRAPSHPAPVFGERIPLRVASGRRRHWVFDLGEPQHVGSIVLAFGHKVSSLPPRVTIEVGERGRWTTAWAGPVAALAVRGGLRDPIRVPVVLEVPGAFGRFLRIRTRRRTIEDVAAFRPRSVHLASVTPP